MSRATRHVINIWCVLVGDCEGVNIKCRLMRLHVYTVKTSDIKACRWASAWLHDDDTWWGRTDAAAAGRRDGGTEHAQLMLLARAAMTTYDVVQWTAWVSSSHISWSFTADCLPLCRCLPSLTHSRHSVQRHPSYDAGRTHKNLRPTHRHLRSTSCRQWLSWWPAEAVTERPEIFK